MPRFFILHSSFFILRCPMPSGYHSSFIIRHSSLSWTLRYLGGVPSPPGVYGRMPIPLMGRRFAIRMNRGLDAFAIWGADPMPPISPMVTGCALYGSAHAPKVFMGSVPCPRMETLRYLGGVPSPQGVYGRMPIPLMGRRFAIRMNRGLDAFAIWGADPMPPISPMVTGCALYGSAHAPIGVYGEGPMPLFLCLFLPYSNELSLQHGTYKKLFMECHGVLS